MLLAERPFVRDRDGRVTGRRRLKHVSNDIHTATTCETRTLVARETAVVAREEPMALSNRRVLVDLVRWSTRRWESPPLATAKQL